MSSNGLESLGDMGPGTTDSCQVSTSAHVDFPPSVDTHAGFCPPSADLSNAQCIPAPLATPIPVSDDPASSVVTPCTELSESPSSQALSSMQYSVPVSEHMDDCNSSVMKDKLDSLLDCIPNKVSDVSEGRSRFRSR